MVKQNIGHPATHLFLGEAGDGAENNQVQEDWGGRPDVRVGIKKPTQKNPPKKPPKNHLKKPTKNGFLRFFWVFLNFLFFMKIIQTFLFQTDFLWTNK